MISTLTAQVRVNDLPAATGVLTVTREIKNINTFGGTMKPDLTWEFTDKQGHFHAYGSDGELPTLKKRPKVVTVSGDAEYGTEEWTYEEMHYHCVICDEEAEPGRVRDYAPVAVHEPWEWTVQVQGTPPTSQLASVRIALDGGLFFGVAHVNNVELRSFEEPTYTLLGWGPLGHRNPPPRCTCPLIDVSTSPQEPAFVRGDPTDCRLHGAGRREAIEAAKRKARGEPVNPFSEEQQ